MALSAGTVTAVSDGTRTGSGMSLAIFDAIAAMPGYDRVASPQTAQFATAVAAAIISYLTQNSVISGSATVSNQSLGKTPSPNNANTAIQPPATPVTIPVSGTLW
jgi:hypothetical protein